MFSFYANSRDVLKIDIDNHFTEKQAWFYFRDIIIGIEMCKFMVCPYILEPLLSAMFICI